MRQLSHPRYPTGPNCAGCPFRETSVGYAPVSSPQVHINPDGSESSGEITTPFLFLLEALGADECKQGRNAVGKTGGVFNTLLHQNTAIRRADQTVGNVVRCRPIAWTVNAQGEQVPQIREYNGDYINQRPSPGQIRECASRYTDDLLSRFKGKWVVGLGAVPLQYLAGRPLSVRTHRGTLLSPGKLIDCVNCDGGGKVPGKHTKCKACKGRNTLKCECGGVTKHRKKCNLDFPICALCDSGYLPGKPKKCRECEGAGSVSADPENPYVSEKLSDHQHAFITYHPALLMRSPEMWSVVERDFSRLETLEAELQVYASTRYDLYPDLLSEESSALVEAPVVSIDLETSGKDSRAGEILMVGATHRIGYGCVLDPMDPRVSELLTNGRARGGGDDRAVVGQNFVLFDKWWLHNHGYTVTAEIHDTRFLGKLLNPDTPNDIYYLSGEFADPPMPGYWKSRQDYRDNLERVACMDVDAALRIYKGQLRALSERGQLQLARDYIYPISDVAFDMRAGGLRVDAEELKRVYGTEAQPGVLVRDLQERRLLLPDWGGTRSEGQHAKVQSHLYNMLGLPVQKNRDSGRPTADANALDSLLGLLNQNHKSVRHLDDDQQYQAVGFIELVRSLRDKSKLIGYLKAYSLNARGRLHPELNPLGTGTLRWTSRDPNCQQVPTCKCEPSCYGTDPECRGARGIFLPDEPDWEVMAVDLKQAEVLGMLWCAEQWAVLKKILDEGMDAHFAVAQQILGRDPTKRERTEFKTTTFAILYGEMDKTTAYRLGVPIDEVRRARDQYFRMLPGVVDARTGFIREAMRKGWVTSPFGVRRYIRVERETGRAANQAANAPIQNIPPMVIGYKMLKLAEQLPKPARLWLQVHDEVDLVYPKHLRDEVISCVKDIMADPVPQMPAPQLQMAGGFKFPVDIEIGSNWGNVKGIE